MDTLDLFRDIEAEYIINNPGVDIKEGCIVELLAEVFVIEAIGGKLYFTSYLTDEKLGDSDSESYVRCDTYKIPRRYESYDEKIIIVPKDLLGVHKEKIEPFWKVLEV